MQCIITKQLKPGTFTGRTVDIFLPQGWALAFQQRGVIHAGLPVKGDGVKVRGLWLVNTANNVLSLVSTSPRPECSGGSRSRGWSLGLPASSNTDLGYKTTSVGHTHSITSIQQRTRGLESTMLQYLYSDFNSAVDSRNNFLHKQQNAPA